MLKWEISTRDFNGGKGGAAGTWKVNDETYKKVPVKPGQVTGGQKLNRHALPADNWTWGLLSAQVSITVNTASYSCSSRAEFVP